MINKKAIVYDRGLYLYLAQKLGESLEKVWFYRPESNPYPLGALGEIGEGLPEVEVITNFWEYVDQADIICFFDCYDGDFAHFLKSKGYNVFSSLKSEIMEVDKVYFLQYMAEVGLPVSPTYRAEGLDDLVKHLEKAKGDKYLKTSYYRGDFETYKYKNMEQFKPWLNDLKARIGQRADHIEILVQDPIKSAVEVGYDGFCVDGRYPDNSMVGYEIKDHGFVGRVFEKTPAVLQGVNDLFSPVFKTLGYQGHFSTEIRITKTGETHFIDATCRAPSPPAELMCELYTNYAEAVVDIAYGRLPALKARSLYGAEIILTSPWNDKHELCVQFPKDLARWIKLKNHKKSGDDYYCIPNNNGGIFGGVVGLGDTVEEATKACLDVMEYIEADEMEFDEAVFDKASKCVKAGEKFGVNF